VRNTGWHLAQGMPRSARREFAMLLGSDRRCPALPTFDCEHRLGDICPKLRVKEAKSEYGSENISKRIRTSERVR